MGTEGVIENVMPFRFEWKDESKRAICYIAEGTWNWRDYHQVVRAAAFTLLDAQPGVHSVIDLRSSTRTGLPAGAVAHVRSFGRITQVNLSGRAAVIGVDSAHWAELGLSADGSLITADGMVRFVESEAELERLLNRWAG